MVLKNVEDTLNREMKPSTNISKIIDTALKEGVDTKNVSCVKIMIVFEI